MNTLIPDEQDVSERKRGMKDITKHYRAKRGKGPFRFLSIVAETIVTNLTVAILWVLFHVLNRTTVIGRENVGRKLNTLLLSNHQSMIDSFLVGMSAFFPASFFWPTLMPWNPAAKENFFSNPFLRVLAYCWRCIPIEEGRRDLRALKRMVEVMPHGVMTLFPEGTRMRTDVVGSGRLGAGMLILSTHPKVIPVAIEGMQDVLPIGSYFPRFFKRIYVKFGEPMDYTEFVERGRGKDVYQDLVDEIMNRIRKQHEELKVLRNAISPEDTD